MTHDVTQPLKNVCCHWLISQNNWFRQFRGVDRVFVFVWGLDFGNEESINHIRNRIGKEIFGRIFRAENAGKLLIREDQSANQPQLAWSCLSVLLGAAQCTDL